MDDRPLAIAAAALAVCGRLSLPAFGPFTLPPSDGGDRGRPGGEGQNAVTVEVFPVVAVWRVAGRRRHPVLRGGSTTVSRSTMSVTWSGAPDWRERRAAAAGIANGCGRESALRHARPASGRGRARVYYRLRRDDDLVLSSSGGSRDRGPAGWPSKHARPRSRGARLARPHPDTMSLLVMPRIRGAGSVAGLRGGVDRPRARFRLPGERILHPRHQSTRRTGGGVEHRRDGRSLGIATRLAPRSARRRPQAGIAGAVGAPARLPAGGLGHRRGSGFLLRAAQQSKQHWVSNLGNRQTGRTGGGDSGARRQRARLGWGRH